MCCLRYEHDTYEYEIKRTPPVDSLVRTVDGVGVVTEINPLAATIKVKLTASPDTPPKSYKRDEVTVLKKKENS
jgi:cell fate regulator YaaT (PSP1 superfamily)